MNFDVKKMFGYPVLRDSYPNEDRASLDYPRASFQPDLRLEIDPKEKDKLIVDYDIAISVPELEALVNKGLAEYRLNISCKSTFFSECFPITESGRQELNGTNLRDQIEMIVSIVTTRDISFAAASSWNEDYGEEPINVPSHSILAWHTPFYYNVERERFRSLRALIDFTVKPDLEDGETIFDGSDDYVRVFVNQKTLDAITRAGQTSNVSQQNVLASIYHGICCEMLVEMQSMTREEDDLQSRRWSSILDEKCRELGLDWEAQARISSNAQALLGNIFKHLVGRNFGENV